MTVALLLVLFFGLLLMGVPVAVALGGSALVTSLVFSPISAAVVGQKVLSNINQFPLMAVPFFFFAAALMEAGGLVHRLVNLANALVGHWRGGLGITAVLASMLFAAISGSSPATVAGVGRIMYPSLLREGYTPRYSIGALATAGSLGILIPPSIPMILYGFVTETSVTRLFLAGVIPGVIYGCGLMLMARFLAGRTGVARRPKASWAERAAAFKSAGGALLLPVFIFVGIYGFPAFDILDFRYEGGGIFTPTEAAVMAAALALVIGLFVYKETTLRSAITTIIETSPSVGMIFFITINALLFAFFIITLGIPDAVSRELVALHTPQWLFLLLINLALIIVGFFLEGVPTILMFIPVLFPAAKALEIDPIHFGVIVIVNIELGLIHPPMGFNLFVGSTISHLPVMEVFKGVLPWMMVTIATLVLITYVPEVSLYLPHLILG